MFAKKVPRYIHGIIYIAQVVNINEGDKISCNFLNKITKLENDEKSLNILREIGMPPYKNRYTIKNLNKLIFKYNGNILKLSEITFILKSILFKYYNLFDWIKFIKGIIISNRYMYSEMSCINLFNEIDSIDVPIYFCVGDNDYSTPVKLIKEYYNFIRAPKKELYRFKSSLHIPNIEEETTFYNLCKTVCADND